MASTTLKRRNKNRIQTLHTQSFSFYLRPPPLAFAPEGFADVSVLGNNGSDVPLLVHQPLDNYELKEEYH